MERTPSRNFFPTFNRAPAKEVPYFKEMQFIFYVVGLYVSFIYWGYVQEKLTSTTYTDSGRSVVWDYPIALNTLMAVAAAFAATVVELLITGNSAQKLIPFTAYWKAALTCALASPMGYASLKYISFPMHILVKSSKPVPVMLIGTFLYQRVYSKFKYLSVFLMCGGIAIFSAAKKGKHHDGDGHMETMKQLIGVVFVALNLSLDGYTNNEQDEIFSKGATSLELMKSVNLWQVGYLFVYLLLGFVVLGPDSEASKAIYALSNFPEIQWDIFWFCVCASSGQLLIFAVMKQYGSLVWITVSITRKLLTVLFSVIIFKHSVNIYQWAGIAAAGVGMLLEVYVGYAEKKKSNKPIVGSKDPAVDETTCCGPAIDNKAKKTN